MEMWITKTALTYVTCLALLTSVLSRLGLYSRNIVSEILLLQPMHRVRQCFGHVHIHYIIAIIYSVYVRVWNVSWPCSQCNEIVKGLPVSTETHFVIRKSSWKYLNIFPSVSCRFRHIITNINIIMKFSKVSIYLWVPHLISGNSMVRQWICFKHLKRYLADSLFHYL